MKPVFAIPLFLLALPTVAAETPCQKIEGLTDFFLGKYKLNENPDYYKLYLVQGKIYNQSFIDTRTCDYVKVPDYRSDANLHNILFPTPLCIVKPYKKSKEQ
jgi:hypothetical protein